MAGAAAALVTGHAAAQSSVTLYGRIDTDVEVQNRPGGRATQLTDNASRWGMRGTEALGGGLSAAFGLEQGFGVDTGEATTPAYRNAYVGLMSTSLGAIALGRLDSSTIVGSPIYSQVTAYSEFVIHDAGATAIGTKVLNARNRVSNAVGYQSPEFGGFSVRARINLAGPDPALPASNPSPVKAEDDFRQMDVGLNYSNGDFGAGVGYSHDSKTGGLKPNDFRSKWQGVATYDFGIVQPYAIYGRDTYVGTRTTRDKVDYWLVGIALKAGVHAVTTNYMQRDVQADPNGKLKKFQIGYSYQMSKRTMPYVFFDREDPNSNRKGNLITTFGAGIQHKF